MINNDLHAQDTGSAESKTAATAAEVAKKLTNPIVNIISLPFQRNRDLDLGNYNGSKMVLNIQPVIPISLSKACNLITHWFVPVVSQQNIKAEKTSEAGLDEAVISGFFSSRNSSITWGVGPVFHVPTATYELLGTQKFGVSTSVVLLTRQMARLLAT